MTCARQVTIIAEAGVNHDGSLAMAIRLAEEAAAAGVDAVKFQTFRAERLLTSRAPKAAYQLRTTDAGESQYDMIRRLELDASAHHALRDRCNELGIDFLSTPFDAESLRFLDRELDLPRLKIGSGEITNAPLLLQAAVTGKRLILSTGMSTLGEVEAALSVLAFGYIETGESPSRTAFARAFADPAARRRLAEQVVLLHCTTDYPTAYADVNLRAMETLRTAFGVEVGLSDHTPGIEVSIAAVARGAAVIEKHFTLDRGLPGPDHAASLELPELQALVRSIRNLEQALGSGTKVPSAAETANAAVARKSLVAIRPVRRGEPFSTANLGVKRPGTGISPFFYWDLIGTPAPRDFAADEILDDCRITPRCPSSPAEAPSFKRKPG